jgi:hypothetical protein
MKDDALAIVETMQAFPVIATEDQYREAGELYKAGQAALKEIDLRHQDDIDFAHREHKRLIAVRDAVKKPVEEAVRRIKGHMAVYRDEQERAARAERARLEAGARKREDDRKLAEALAVEASEEHRKRFCAVLTGFGDYKDTTGDWAYDTAEKQRWVDAFGKVLLAGWTSLGDEWTTPLEQSLGQAQAKQLIGNCYLDALAEFRTIDAATPSGTFSAQYWADRFAKKAVGKLTKS